MSGSIEPNGLVKYKDLYDILKGYASTLEVRYMIEAAFQKAVTTGAGVTPLREEPEGKGERPASSEWLTLLVEAKVQEAVTHQMERWQGSKMGSALPPLPPPAHTATSSATNGAGIEALQLRVNALESELQRSKEQSVRSERQWLALVAALENKTVGSRSDSVLDSHPLTEIPAWKNDEASSRKKDTNRIGPRKDVRNPCHGSEQTSGVKTCSFLKDGVEVSQRARDSERTHKCIKDVLVRCEMTKRTSSTTTDQADTVAKRRELGLDAIDVPTGALDRCLSLVAQDELTPMCGPGRGGVRVLAVNEGSSAQNGGLLPGDVVLEVVGWGSVETCAHLREAVRSSNDHDGLTLVLYRPFCSSLLQATLNFE